MPKKRRKDMKAKEFINVYRDAKKVFDDRLKAIEEEANKKKRAAFDEFTKSFSSKFPEIDFETLLEIIADDSLKDHEKGLIAIHFAETTDNLLDKISATMIAMNFIPSTDAGVDVQVVFVGKGDDE